MSEKKNRRQNVWEMNLCLCLSVYSSQRPEVGEWSDPSLMKMKLGQTQEESYTALKA